LPRRRRDLVTYNLNFGNQYNNTGKTVYTLKSGRCGDAFRGRRFLSPSVGFNFKLNKNNALLWQLQQSFLGNPRARSWRPYDYQFANEKDRGFGTTA